MRLLTVEQVRERLQLKRSTAYHLVRHVLPREAIITITTSTRPLVRVDESKLDEWIESRRGRQGEADG